MQELYERTSLTKRRVAQSSGYIDWATQPSIFKHYPDFLFSYAYGEKEELLVLELSRCITLEQTVASKPYYKLNTPSAGNLHPVELYVQIRGIKGIISGIYHVDAGAKKFVLLYEIESNGMETELGLAHKFHGMLCFVSCVPFRSEWKYGERALRYIYLDVGHQVAALKASAKLLHQESTILSHPNLTNLNLRMGFREDESLCSVFAIGKMGDKNVTPIKKNLLHVSPTNYTTSDMTLKSIIKKQPLLDALPYTYMPTKEVILQRRSAREFGVPSSDDGVLTKLIESWKEVAAPLTCHELFFQEALIPMMLDQHFIKNAQRIIVLTCHEFSAKTLMLAGAFMHKIYLETLQEGMACSSIGAFYDADVQKLLHTKESVLCVCALGKERSV
jgi:SagB-type dehydrogenase family enzyme